MRTMFDGESVDVETDINHLGQLVHDAAAAFGPGRSRESGASERARIEHSDPPVRSGPFGLGIAIIPHADLHELAHLRQVAQYVEHDRSVRKFESLVRLTQIAMSIDMENSQRTFLLGNGTDQTVRRRMVASNQPYDLTLREPLAGLTVNIVVHGCTAFVDTAQTALDTFVVRRSAFFEVFDHPFGIGPQLAGLLLQRIVDIGRSDASEPGSRRRSVVEIELRGGFDQGIRCRKPFRLP